jgi:hypothetical protein
MAAESHCSVQHAVAEHVSYVGLLAQGVLLASKPGAAAAHAILHMRGGAREAKLLSEEEGSSG